MKVRDTSPGRLYALSSEIGCVAINGAMAVDIPAGGQVVVLALDKKIVIDGDDAAKFVEVRWGTNTVVGSRPAPAWLSDVLSGLISIVGDANFDINYIPAENKLSLQFSLEVTTEQIAEVQTLLDRELPSNIVTEIDPFPIDFTKVEYLESNTLTYIQTDINSDTDIGLQVRCSFSNRNHNLIFEALASRRSYIGMEENAIRVRRYGIFNLNIPYTPDILTTQYNYKNSRTAKIDDKIAGPEDYIVLDANGPLVTFFCARYITQACLYTAEITKGTNVVRNLIPALDNTGAPCMFDTVTRTPFYNAGTGDFLYPGAEQAVMTLDLDLDAKSYAKLTEHGVRRLYHVPKGYTGTMDDYAAENGFKELVEPPMPFEGYWAPVWRETETQLICDWVETEPPTEEELQIEDTENA